MTLQEAIVVKISHDLAGGIGAFINTVDLIKLDNSFEQEGLDLLISSGEMLTARLKFFRVLYGAENKAISNTLVKDYLATLAVKTEIQGNISTRLQVAMVAVGCDILALGGTIKVQSDSLVLTGKELTCNPLFIQALMGTSVPCTPETVNALWLFQLVHEQQKKLTLDTKKSELVLTLT